MTYLNIETRHKEFFGLVCYHDYYTKLLCKDLEIQPSEETNDTLRNYFLVFKPLPFGFLVTYSPNESPQRLKDAPKELRLSFVVTSRVTRFMNYTDIPFQSVWEGLHFSNMGDGEIDLELEIPREVYYYFKQLNVASSRKKLLHLPEFTEVISKPRKFNSDIVGDGIAGSEVSYNDIEILDEWGKDTLADGRPLKKDIHEVQRAQIGRHLQQLEKNLRREGIRGEELEKRLFEMKNSVADELGSQLSHSHTFDLRHAPYGLYKFGVKGKEMRPIYLSQRPEQRIFGMIDIHLDPTQTDALINREASDEETVQPKLYHLHFRARKTHWRYFFMKHKQSRVSATVIKEENERLVFSEPESVRLESVGTPAMCSISDRPIALSERPQYNLLLERAIGKRTIKEIKLPVPSIDLIKPIRSAPDGEVKVYSDIYVYL